MAEPQFEDEKPVNVFDFDTGANFKLKIRNVEGYRNYDKSEFEGPTPIADEDSEIERIWATQNSLTDFLESKHFKSYDELKKKLDMVLSGSAAAVAKRAEETDFQEEDIVAPKAAAPKPAPAPAPKRVEEDEDELSYFAKLAEDD